MNPWYTDYSDYLARLFPGRKMQKLSVNAGLGCPNRDGTLGRDGCIYCDNRAFTPSYCNPDDTIAEQLRKGKEFFRRKYPRMGFLAYFQSFTNTYGDPARLCALYSEALAEDDVEGLVIGTRPDCLSDEVLHFLAETNRTRRVILEFGAETSFDTTLQAINRHHTWAQTEDAVKRTADAGISCGLHLIAGFPGENREKLLTTIDRCCTLPIDTIKLHQLQIVRGTPMHRLWQQGKLNIILPTVEEYIDTCIRVIEIVPRRIALERFVSQSPAELLVAPRWGLKNYEFTNLLHQRLRNRKNGCDRC